MLVLLATKTGSMVSMHILGSFDLSPLLAPCCTCFQCIFQDFQ